MPIWKRLDPSMKVEAGSTEIQHDSVSVVVVRPENAVSRCKLVANDYQGKNFIANLLAFTNLKVSFRYGSDSWTKMLDGVVEDVGPSRSKQGQLLTAVAYGLGRSSRNTYCNATYGTESENPTKDTPGEIWLDIIANYVKKSFGGSNTGYLTTGVAIGGCGTTPTIKFISGNGRSCLAFINEVCLLRQAGEAGSAGVHWFAGTDDYIRFKTITADGGADWPLWWNTDEAGSTLVEGVDFLTSDFHYRVRSKEFANKVLLACDLRKPGYDYWTEDADTNGLWDETDADMTIADDAVNYIVGADSLKFTAGANSLADGFYPKTAANWDFSNVGSKNNPPHISFYARRENNANHGVQLQLCTTDLTNYYYRQLFNTAGSKTLMPDAGEWYHLKFPLYYGSGDEHGWTKINNADWTNIDFINVEINNTGFAGPTNFWLDDLHFNGKLIRVAKNTYSIDGNVAAPVVAQKNEHQALVRMATSLDDSMIASDDSGSAAQLAYAELLTRDYIPMVGTIQTPGIVDILPGQKVHVHADKQGNGSFRVDADFRVKEIQHSFNNSGFTTTLQLTDDLVRTFAKSPSETLSVLAQAVFTDPEAMSLRTSGVDWLVPRLSKTYDFDDDYDA